MPCACTIAGSDSGGGAGIQADLKTFSALGVWGCSVVTAVTAQNTRGVRGVWTLPPAAVASQIGAVVDDFAVGAFKTGMLAEAGIIRTVAGALPEDAVLVVDPVMIATSGARLLAEDAVDALTADLLPRAALVTPNIPEAEVLSGLAGIDSAEGMIDAGRRILRHGPGAVLVKGGHLSGGEAVDVLVTHDGVSRLSGERHPGSVHGSGCCLAAAITAFLVRGEDLSDACRHAKAFAALAITHAAIAPSGASMVNPGAVRWD
ncbi:MAG: bifunctional hydroxymethylpyrimidine kinase/phosphomethylpyrimidine kinase [Methanomicrobiales archaeon]|nr:bifunctional hydroxymethylpyrimidine kinase/phosphomethylpyrimidine kinase [Methanomicrobiales archaeon]